MPSALRIIIVALILSLFAALYAYSTIPRQHVIERTIEPTILFGSDSGFKTTGTVSAAGSWTNFTTTRINTSDNSRASCNVSGSDCNSTTAKRAVIHTFGFGIPAGATIDGIELAIEGLCTNGTGDNCSASTGDVFKAELTWNSGTNYTAQKTSSEVGTTETTYTLGGSADTWGHSWTVSELADGTFRARIAAACSQFSTCGDGDGFYPFLQIDRIQIKVYYTDAAAVRPLVNPIIWFD